MSFGAVTVAAGIIALEPAFAVSQQTFGSSQDDARCSIV
jgi:hypothetical protein